MAAVCSNCGTKLGFGRRLEGKGLCASCEANANAAAAAEARAQAAAVAAAAAAHAATLSSYLRVAQQVPSQDSRAIAQLQSIADKGGLTATEVVRANLDAYRATIAAAIQDEYLTEDEEVAIDRMSALLQMPAEERRAVVRSFGNRVLISRMNAGRLSPIEQTSILLKPSEQAYLEMPATLLKETVHRETQGGYRGVSFRVAKGVRFNTGGYRGHSVVTGTTLDNADTGVLCVTSQRAVFKGMRQAIECQFAKMIGMNVFDDGIQFHVSNRQKATLLKVPDGPLVAATVNAVVQRAPWPNGG